MHQTSILSNIRSYFGIKSICLARFLSTIEVGNTGRYCSRSGLVNGKDNPWTQHCCVYPIGVIFGIPKHPHLLETELKYLWNADYAAMVKARGQKNEKAKKQGRGLGMYLALLMARRTSFAETKDNNPGL